MDISKASCPSCDKSMTVTRLECTDCGLRLEGTFELPGLARLPLTDQVFVVAFLRHHGNIRKMESLLGISYPTVKNRLNAVSARIDESFETPEVAARPTKLDILDELDAGEIDVEEALRKLRSQE